MTVLKYVITTKELIMLEKEYITKQEVLKTLKSKYKIKEFEDRTLQYYIQKGVIKPGRMKRVKKVSGSVSYYPKNTPELIMMIRYLTSEKINTLKEIQENLDILNFKNIKKINEFYEEIFSGKTERHNILFENGIIKITPLAWELMDLHSVGCHRALVEFGIFGEDSFDHIYDEKAKIFIKKNKDNEFSIIFEFAETLGKRVIFKKTGTIIEEIK